MDIYILKMYRENRDNVIINENNKTLKSIELSHSGEDYFLLLQRIIMKHNLKYIYKLTFLRSTLLELKSQSVYNDFTDYTMLNKPFKNESYVLSITLALLIFLFLMPFNLTGQIKYEREYKLKIENVPGAAITFIDSCCPESKGKWYGEENFTGKSIEAKIKYQGSLYSIEFDTSGYIQDVEKKIRVQDIPQNTRLVIINKLDSIFSKHKIEKVQVQWVGSNEVLYELIGKIDSTLPYTTNYEIVIKGRKEKSIKVYEILFSMDGSILIISEMVQSSTDNLDY